VKLLHESVGHIVTVELKTGELYRGKLDEAEDNMNCQMSTVMLTARDGSQHPLEQAFLRGSHIKFVILPDMLKNAPMFRKELVKAGRDIGQGEDFGPGRGGRGGGRGGRGRGRGGRGGPGGANIYRGR